MIEAFSDQTTSPTYTVDVARALTFLLAALERRSVARAPRIYHVTNAGGCTRLAFAHQIVDLLGRSRACVRPIRMRDQARPAPRPACSALAGTALRSVTGISSRSWEEALRSYLEARGVVSVKAAA